MTLQDRLSTEVAAAMQRLDELVTAFEEHPDPGMADALVEVLRAVDVLHRGALQRLVTLLDDHGLRGEAFADPHVALLFALYDEAQEQDEQSRAEAAVADVRPYVEAHGGRLDVIAAEDGVVQVRLLGACESCSASSATLRAHVEDALRAALPDFVRMDVDTAPAHTSSRQRRAPVLIPLSAVVGGASGQQPAGGGESRGGCGVSGRGCSACG